MKFAGHRRSGITLIELVIAIGLIGLIVDSLIAGLQSSLFLITEGKIKTSANAIAGEQIERIRSLDYGSVGTYLKTLDCEVYDTDDSDCVVGVPAGPIPQVQSETLNNINFTIKVTIENVDDDRDGSGASDENGVLNDYKIAEVKVEWQARSGLGQIRLTTKVAPAGVETTDGGGSLRVNVQDSMGDPVSGLEVLIVNDATTPAISQPGVTDVNGRRLLSGLEQASGYEVFVNIDEGLSIIDTDYGYERTYQDGEVWPYNQTTTAITSPNPDKLTVEEGLITSITFVIDQTADIIVEAYEASVPEAISAPFFNPGLLSQSQTIVSGGVLQLDTNPATLNYYTLGSAETTSLEPAGSLLNWLWFEFGASGISATELVSVQFYYDDEGSNVLVPDGVLPGNSSGFSPDDSPIDLQGINILDYPDMQVKFELRGSGTLTPQVDSATIHALVQGDPVSGVEFRLFGVDWVGKRSSDTSQKVWKYDITQATDETGMTIYENMAADKYRPRLKTLSGYAELYSCPKAEKNFTLVPGIDQLISSTWRSSADTTDALAVSVQSSDGQTVYPGISLILEGDLAPRQGITNDCGQYVFGDVPAGTFDLSLSGPGISPQTSSVVISGLTEHVEEI